MKNTIGLFISLTVGLWLPDQVNSQDLTGSVITVTGDQIPDVSVSLTSPSGVIESTKSDENGRFNFSFDTVDINSVFELEAAGYITLTETLAQQGKRLFVLRKSRELDIINQEEIFGHTSLVIDNAGYDATRKYTSQITSSVNTHSNLDDLSYEELVACMPQDLVVRLAKFYQPAVFPPPLFPQGINFNGDPFCFDTSSNGSVVATQPISIVDSEPSFYNVLYTTNINAGTPVVSVGTLAYLTPMLIPDNQLVKPGDAADCRAIPDFTETLTGEYVSATMDYAFNPPAVYTADITETFLGAEQDSETGMITREWQRSQVFEGLNGNDVSITEIKLTETGNIEELDPDHAFFKLQSSKQSIANSYNGEQIEEIEITTKPSHSPWSEFRKACAGTAILAAGGDAEQMQQDMMPADGPMDGSMEGPTLSTIEVGSRIKAVVGYSTIMLADREVDVMETIDLDLSNGKLAIALFNLSDGWVDRQMVYGMEYDEVEGGIGVNFRLESFLLSTGHRN